ncbi:murein L,D-transpeptidase YcbB/YkuD [Bradyrhizobium sp. GM2.2]|jgi:murein L,D-transpeptidase YcbB/YkuD|uniref:L,D-transpeptidase family protein n=1 Tax=unclassified Bradyrhizobium TaxID=2631580 RepID=UPI000477715B|nr:MULTISPECIES: L,D-transpeptidase family protein [unclassified Bradyrhizobium]MCK1271475.1 L,D-transpeptidase family protein [Bradyrhizobium sp. 84]MCK1295981.1 L,D-transpeptidase family protein [Bradyrhizobium sp. 30]MCK1308823.1 L,D-transpeptidase family protein [Bradyrhizobium sp. 45]MCK1315261.1 L,D-transpeptidase family protein [Bradyrhizobium sp. 23]MCK1327398.1 L,D-transpeptidase family protein [Bradyrhizobium sp. CW9]
MRDCLNHRAGFDRVLITVAATFLTVSASSALAQDQAHSSAAELAIEAAIPRPEPANVPPPTASDIKLDTTATVVDPAKEPAKEPLKAESAPAPDKVETKPSDVATTPAAEATKSETAKTEPAKTEPAKADTAIPTPAAPATAAAPASEPVRAASNVPAADQPVADKLKDIIGAKASRYLDRKNERAAIEKFYGARDFAPVWSQGGSLTAAAKGVIARLKDAASDGLNPADYPVPDFAAATTPDTLADAELKLTASMFDYARQAQSGRMHWSQVSGDILYPEHPVDPNEVLAKVTTAADASAALDSYNPPQKLYKELKAKLAELRGQGNGPVIEIADGPALKYTPAGKKQAEIVVEDPRVPQLRAKLGITENASDTRYDAAVAEAVRKFQNSAELKATGILDDKTVRAINAPKRDKQIDVVLVNMERWRWLPRDLGAPSLGDAYVILNIPDYTLKVMQRGQQVWTTRVVTGKPGTHATPLLTETMKYITVNPTWNVPPSIVYNEYLPALQQDPTVLQRMGLKLEQNRDGSVHISQPPGEANALGRIRFNFPNKFLVYQHDTPDKNLFARDERAFSHGCMRVQNPDQYASVLLNIAMPNEKYTPERIRSMYGKSEIDLKFPTPIPVNITYQTAFVDDGGKLQFRKDVYGRDATMINILKNGRGKDLENVVAHSQPSYSRPATTLPNGVLAANNGGSSGPNFFERLFGAPTPPPAPVGRRPQQQRVFTR